MTQIEQLTILGIVAMIAPLSIIPLTVWSDKWKRPNPFAPRANLPDQSLPLKTRIEEFERYWYSGKSQ